MSHKNNTIRIVKGIIVALLLLCLIDADYGFYQAMRTLISFGFAFLTYNYYKAGDKTNAIIFLCLLIVFQPLMKIGLGRGVWIVVDIIVAGFLLFQIIKTHVDTTSTPAKTRVEREQNNLTTSESSIKQTTEKIRKKW